MMEFEAVRDLLPRKFGGVSGDYCRHFPGARIESNQLPPNLLPEGYVPPEDPGLLAPDSLLEGLIRPTVPDPPSEPDPLYVVDREGVLPRNAGRIASEPEILPRNAGRCL